MKLPESYYNKISYVGTVIASVSLLLMFFIFLVSTFFDAGGNYIGLLLYMGIPIMLVFGLILIPIGMLIRLRKIKRSKVEIKATKMIIDFNNRNHRNAAIIFFMGTIVFLILTGIGSYEAFHYTESNEFCGTLCHKVMEPEYTTYQTSSHAHVKCVECHVGPGAEFFVQSKLSGLYQVYSVLRKIYPQPIPTPISSLRPARITCEQCHWPEKFFPNRIKNEIHFLTDSANTQWDISYRMKIGPSHTSKGNSEGIHWHINSKIKVEYIESSPDREYISWVRYINLSTGDTILYEDTDNPIDEELKLTAVPRTMDCMDCHNRPSHQYLPPQDYVDHAIVKGDIPVELPGIKKISMDILRDSYKTTDTAYYSIKTKVYDFYSTNYPKVFKSQKMLIDKSILGLENVYSANNFPHMGANWDAYPNHVGHIEYNGCFRCHDDKHVADNGNVIRRDCDLCHTIIQQGTSENNLTAMYNESLEFKHPVDIEESWKEYSCSECHRYLY